MIMKVLISSSGTGGHLIPAIQLAKKLKLKGSDIFFAAHGLESRELFIKENFSYLDISASQINKKKIFFAFFKILKGFFQSLKLILKYKPSVIVGFGSYHTFPVILAAYVLRKKIILYDSNIELGQVNKIFAKKAKVVATQFEKASKLKHEILVKRFPWYIKDDKKKNLKSDILKKVKLEKNIFTILIFGGSQGSSIINENFVNNIRALSKKQKVQIVHILGHGIDKTKINKIYDDLHLKSYVSNFEKDLDQFYKISDLVISRAGACSISEQIYFEKPSILIPYKNAKDNHQLKNALFMQNAVKSAIVITEDSLLKDTLLNEINFFLENGQKKLCLFKKNIQKFKHQNDEKNKNDLTDLVLKLGKRL